MDEQVRDGPLQRVVQRLKEATAAMEGLLTRLLDLSRLQSGTVQVQAQPLALQALLTAVAVQHAEQAHRKGLRLRVYASSAVVHSDPALLEQILGNLIGNAVRYTRRGGVLLGVRPAGLAHWRVAVWDTGPGIAHDARHAIFGEFVRGTHLHEGEDIAAGLGLGLAIAQRAAALLGAEVALRSEPGRGSCFSVVLPRALAAAVSTPAPHLRPTLPRPLAGRRLWLLEDDPNARASMQLLLQHWGAEVHAFSSLTALRGVDALVPAPELLISDLRLPDGQGSDALLHLRERWPDQPALFVTGNTAPEDLAALERWREAGIPVLIKPYATATLQSALLATLVRARD
jgi:CheY-like chemotaxis protein